MLLNNMIAVTLEVETFPVQSNCEILKFHELTFVDNRHTKISQTLTFAERVKNHKKAKVSTPYVLRMLRINPAKYLTTKL